MSDNDSLGSFCVKATLVVLLVTVSAGLVLACWTLRVLVIDLILALTIASAISPLAEYLELRKIPRLITVAFTYTGVVVFYAVVAVLVAEPFREQASLFASQIPEYTDEIKQSYRELLAFAGDQAPMLQMHAEDLRAPALRLVGQTLDITRGLMGLLLNSVLVLFLAAFFVIEANQIWERLLLWIPPRYRLRARLLISPLAARMGGYVRGQILVSTAVAAFFAAGLSLIGVKYGLVLGLLGGLLNLLPFVGSIITTVLALFVASNQGIITLLLTLGLFAVEQFVESNFIVPHLLGRQVDMHPLVVLFAILVGASLAGAVGALVAVPLSAALLFLAQEFYLKPINASSTEVRDTPGPETGDAKETSS